MFVPVEDAVAAVKDFLAYQDGARATFEAMMAAAGDTTTALIHQSVIQTSNSTIGGAIAVSVVDSIMVSSF